MHFFFGTLAIIHTFGLWHRSDVGVRFPVCSALSRTSPKVLKAEEQIKIMNWKKERLVEDMQREETLLHKVKESYTGKKNELLALLKGSNATSL